MSKELLSRFQAKLVHEAQANPDLWMVRDKSSAVVTEEHMVELAVIFKIHDKVVVRVDSSLQDRRAVVEFIGKVPEIAPGFWIGVSFEKPDGKNDGSIEGSRYFRCPENHGSFVRPNRVSLEMDTAAKAKVPSTARKLKSATPAPSSPQKEAKTARANGAAEAAPAADGPSPDRSPSKRKLSSAKGGGTPLGSSKKLGSAADLEALTASNVASGGGSNTSSRRSGSKSAKASGKKGSSPRSKKDKVGKGGKGGKSLKSPKSPESAPLATVPEEA